MICVFARFRVFYYVPCFATHAVRLSHAVFASASFTSPRRSECVCRHSCRRFPRSYSSFLVPGSFLFRSVLCLRLLETSSPFVISKPRNFIHISLYIFSLHYFCLSSFEYYFFLLYMMYCYCKTLTLCFGWFAGLHDRLHRRRAPCLRASPREFSDLGPACALLVERRSASANAAGVTLGCECEGRSGSLQEPLDVVHRR